MKGSGIEDTVGGDITGVWRHEFLFSECLSVQQCLQRGVDVVQVHIPHSLCALFWLSHDYCNVYLDIGYLLVGLLAVMPHPWVVLWGTTHSTTGPNQPQKNTFKTTKYMGFIII